MGKTNRSNPYIGHHSQVSSVEEHRLVGGKGDGMRLLQVNSGSGLQMTLSLDRCADIARLQFKGDNYGYFSPVGYVAPAFYDCQGEGFLKSFTAGFLTTCGLEAVGAPCSDEGEELPLHGSIANTPAEEVYWTEDEEKIEVHATVYQARIFQSKLVLDRIITCYKQTNQVVLRDTIENIGDQRTPCMVLYHMNMGYPLLSEKSQVVIPSSKVIPRNARAKEDIATWDKMLKPQMGFEEQCYYHQFEEEGKACIYNPDIQKGLMIRFDSHSLRYFTEWKMMGYKDYVLGLEPGNCNPDGRDVMRKEKTLQFLNPGESVTYQVELNMIAGLEEWSKYKNYVEK